MLWDDSVPSVLFGTKAATVLQLAWEVPVWPRVNFVVCTSFLETVRNGYQYKLELTKSCRKVGHKLTSLPAEGHFPARLALYRLIGQYKSWYTFGGREVDLL